MIYLNPSDRPPAAFQELKTKLNQEFNEKGKIQGLVSYLYFPTCASKRSGHTEVEIEGTGHTILLGHHDRHLSLSKVAQRSMAKGRPFYRIPFDVTPRQLRMLKIDTAIKYTDTICSCGALKVLSKNGVYSVPFLLRTFPSSSFFYLKLCKALGSKGIKKIECYDNPSVRFISKWIGVAGEMIRIPLILAYLRFSLT